MAFLIPDNLKSRRDVPEGVRRVAAAFQLALDDAATLWFEPPFDPSGQKPHFVLLLPDRGVLVLELLEVKGGSGFLGVLRGKLRVLRDGTEVAVENPLDRARRFAGSLKQRMAALPELANLELPVAAGAVFHVLGRQDAEEKGLAAVVPEELSLFREEIEAAISGNGEATLQRAFARMLGGKYRDRLSGDEEKRVRGVIQPDTVIGSRGAAGTGQLIVVRPPEESGDVIRIMDRSQEAMAKSLGEGHRVIRGVAGSGKTLILVYRARLLSKLLPRDSILVTCYTRSLAGQLRDVLADCSNVHVKHLDGMMSEFIRRAGLPKPDYKADRSGEMVSRTALNALAQVNNPRYRAVLLDEAQDFGESALRFALGLLESKSEDFILVADAAQNIFRKNFRFKDVGIKAQGRTRILRQNYRNTQEILEAARRFLLAGGDLHEEAVPDEDDATAVIPPEAALRRGPIPRLVMSDSDGSEIDAVVERVRSWVQVNCGPRSVGILYSATDGAVFRLVSRLRSEGVGAFWLTDPKDPAARDRFAMCRDPVVLTTVHSAKGLEFPRVILTGAPNDSVERGDYRKLAYVGMTRATEELEVIISRRHPFAEDFFAALGGAAA